MENSNLLGMTNCSTTDKLSLGPIDLKSVHIMKMAYLVQKGLLVQSISRGDCTRLYYPAVK